MGYRTGDGQDENRVVTSLASLTSDRTTDCINIIQFNVLCYTDKIHIVLSFNVIEMEIALCSFMHVYQDHFVVGVNAHVSRRWLR